MRRDRRELRERFAERPLVAELVRELGLALQPIGRELADLRREHRAVLVVADRGVAGEQQRLEVGAAAVERAAERRDRNGVVAAADREPAALAIELPRRGIRELG